MAGEIEAIDELERRLVATYYGDTGRPARLLLARRWAPAAAVLAAAAVVAVIGAVALGSGSVSLPLAQAALERAAAAARTSPAPVLGPGRVWYARTIQTWIAPMPIPPRTGRPLLPTSSWPTVSVLFRAVTDVWVTADGAVRERTISSESFLSALDAALYGRPLQRPTTTVVAHPGRGRLPSPLFPIVPLLSYRQLRSLPTQSSRLRRVVAQLQAHVDADGVRAAASANSAPTRTNRQPPPASHGTQTAPRTTVTVTMTGTVVGSCCGSAPVVKRAVSDLNMIGWLLAMPVPANVHAALYRTAATLPGVRYDGPARDALGRTGTEISVGTGAAQMRLIFNQHTGALLASTTTFGATAQQLGIGPLSETLQATAVVPSTPTGKH